MICPASSVAATPVPIVSIHVRRGARRRIRRGPARPKDENASVELHITEQTAGDVEHAHGAGRTPRPRAATRPSAARPGTRQDSAGWTLTGQLRSSPDCHRIVISGHARGRPGGPSLAGHAEPRSVSGSLFLQGEADVRGLPTPVRRPRRARAAAPRRGRIGLRDHRDTTRRGERARLLFHLHPLDALARGAPVLGRQRAQHARAVGKGLAGWSGRRCVPAPWTAPR